MSVEAMALVLHHSHAKGSDKLVLLGIANHAGDGGAWPSIATLARYANLTERAVQDVLRRLERSGELATYRQQGGGAGLPTHQRPNRYEVMVACPPTCDRTAQHRVRELAKAQADLWIDGVKPTSPGAADFTGGVQSASPGGVQSTSPEPPIEPTSTHRSNYGDQSAREVEHLATCSICSLTFDQCTLRERTSGHSWTPAPGAGARLLAQVAAQYDDLHDDLAVQA